MPKTQAPRRDVGAPDLRLSGAVDRVNLNRSIEKLPPPGYRTVFVLHDVQGYEHNEIADIMGCSVGNSKSQLHKARNTPARASSRRCPRSSSPGTSGCKISDRFNGLR